MDKFSFEQGFMILQFIGLFVKINLRKMCSLNYLNDIAVVKTCLFLVLEINLLNFFSRFLFINPSSPGLGQREKINLNFYFQTSFHASKSFMKAFKAS